MTATAPRIEATLIEPKLLDHEPRFTGWRRIRES